MLKKVIFSFILICIAGKTIAMQREQGLVERNGRIILRNANDWQTYQRQLLTHLNANDGGQVASLYRKAFSMQGFNKQEYKNESLQTIQVYINYLSLEALSAIRPLFIGTEYETVTTKRLQLLQADADKERVLEAELQKRLIQEQSDAQCADFEGKVQALCLRLETTTNLGQNGLIRLQQDIDYLISEYHDGFVKNADMPEDNKQFASIALKELAEKLVHQRTAFPEQANKLLPLLRVDSIDELNIPGPSNSQVPYYDHENEDIERMVTSAIETNDSDMLHDLSASLPSTSRLKNRIIEALAHIENQERLNEPTFYDAPAQPTFFNQPVAPDIDNQNVEVPLQPEQPWYQLWQDRLTSVNWQSITKNVVVPVVCAYVTYKLAKYLWIASPTIPTPVK